MEDIADEVFMGRPRDNRSFLLQVLKFASLPDVQVPIYAMAYESRLDRPVLYVRYSGWPGTESPPDPAYPFAARTIGQTQWVQFASYGALAEHLMALPVGWFSSVWLRGAWEASPVQGIERGELTRGEEFMTELIPRYTSLARATRAGQVATLNELFEPGDFQSLAEYVLDHMQQRMYKCNVWVEREDGDEVLEPRPKQCREAWLAAVRASGGTAYGLMDAFELPFVRAVVGGRMATVVETIAALSGIGWSRYEPLMFYVGEEIVYPDMAVGVLLEPDIEYTDWREPGRRRGRDMSMADATR